MQRETIGRVAAPAGLVAALSTFVLGGSKSLTLARLLAAT